MAKTVKKSVLILLLCALFVCSAALLVACNKKVTLSFETNGGTPIEAITGKAGEDISAKLPVNPEREGYTFGGWYADEQLTESATLPTVMPEQNATFYAKWTAKQTATLTLNAGSGGTLNETSYSVYVGENIAAFLADKSPTPKQGLEFAGWYDGTTKLSDTRTMPASGITLTAKYNARYTVRVFMQNVDGSYPQTAVERTGKAFYGEPFTYTAEEQHYEIDSAEENVISTSSLGQNVIFTVHLARKIYFVSYLVNNPNSTLSPISYDVRYGATVTVEACAFEQEGYHFAAWTLTSAESNSAYYKPGDSLTVDGDYFFYAQWDKGYTDIFGGMDFVYIPHLQNGVAILERMGVGEKQGSYDKASSTFLFENGGEEMLTGKIVGENFYYYKDTVEKTYRCYSDNDVTLEMKSRGVAVYTVDGASIQGRYDVEENGLYVFSAENTQFVYRLESVENEVVFRIRGDEVGFYSPDAGLISDGVVLYYLNGFGEAVEFYETMELDATYSVSDESDFVVYTLISTYYGHEVHSFDFRIVEGEAVVDGVVTKGSFAVSDGLAETYHIYTFTNTGRVEGTPLYLDGFGNGLYGDLSIQYTVHTARFYAYDSYGDATVINDLWVSFRVGGVEYKARPLYAGWELEYELITDGLFGAYKVRNGYEYNGELRNAMIYVFAGTYEASTTEIYSNYAALFVQVDTESGVPLYQIVDENKIWKLEADENNVYAFSKNKTRFRVVGNGLAELVDAQYSDSNKPLSLVFFDDATGKLELGYDGIALYTGADGVEHEVEYIRERAHGYFLISVITFPSINGHSRVFAIMEESVYDENAIGYVKVPYAVEVTEIYEQSQNSAVRLIVYGEESFGLRLAAIGLLQEGAYNYDLEGRVERIVGGNGYHFTNYEQSKLFSNDYFEFDFEISEGKFVKKNDTQTVEYQNPNGDKLTLNSRGVATYTVKGGEAVIYQYTDYEYNDLIEDVLALYELTRDGEKLLVRIELESGTFSFVNEDAVALLIDLDSMYGYMTGEALMLSYLFLDGEGVAYFFESTGYVNFIYTGTYEKLEGQSNYTEYRISNVLYDYGEILNFTVQVVLEEMYLVKDESQQGNFTVDGGGRISGDGYGYYDMIGIWNVATYVDAQGRSFDGIMTVGTFDDSDYNVRTFTAATAASERKTVEFILLSPLGGGTYGIADVLYFDVQSDGETAVLRNLAYGAFRLIDDGRPSDARLYLDGHGNAVCYDINGNTVSQGSYELTKIGENAYRFVNNGNETEFIFTLYTTEDDSGSDGYIYEYAIYTETEGAFVSDDWRYLQLDGYALALYIDKYGVATYGTYGYVTENIVAFYPDDGSDNLYFEVADKKFDVAQVVDGFIIRENTLYAYVGADTEIEIPNGVTHIAKGAFAHSKVQHVSFNGVTNVGEEAFMGSSLVEIAANNIVTVGRKAFANIATLTTVDLSKAVTVGDSAFFGSKVTVVKLQQVQKIGNGAFALDVYLSLMTLDLTAVDNVSSINWGTDVFAASEDGKLTGATVSAHIVVKNLADVNALYAKQELATVKNSIGLETGELGRYFNFTNGNFYELNHGLIIRLVEDWFEFVYGNTLALYSVDGNNVTVYTLKNDGSGYGVSGIQAGTVDSFDVDGETFVAIGREVTLNSGDNQDVVLKLDFDYYWLSYSYEFTLSVGGDEKDARFNTTTSTFRYEVGSTTMQLTVKSAGECEIVELGTLKTVQSDNEWRIVFIVAPNGTMTIDEVQTYTDEEVWKAELVYYVIQEDTYCYRIAVGVAGITTPETAYLYYAVYTPASEGKEESLTMQYYGNAVKATAEESFAYLVVDVFDGKILEVLSYNDGEQDCEIVSYEQNDDGSITVQMRCDGNEKTYLFKVTYLGRTDYLLEVVEVTDGVTA